MVIKSLVLGTVLDDSVLEFKVPGLMSRGSGKGAHGTRERRTSAEQPAVTAFGNAAFDDQRHCALCGPRASVQSGWHFRFQTRCCGQGGDSLRWISMCLMVPAV